ncbi:hypothetical protein E8D34_00715 [Nocardioides sp. GY 10113]|uniref:hypothetical protein n=1 Tax=Nocardioides sp. GY 10113 TaxID=2569761 RepID=UPI0010A8B76C|nr:hypothetical protein [Nocardioides sp. GY 10113]TIC89069.1 hypothetical protein E8D34_00715 [Nocardioides sp. GY 10113]
MGPTTVRHRRKQFHLLHMYFQSVFDYGYRGRWLGVACAGTAHDYPTPAEIESGRLTIDPDAVSNYATWHGHPGADGWMTLAQGEGVLTAQPDGTLRVERYRRADEQLWDLEICSVPPSSLPRYLGAYSWTSIVRIRSKKYGTCIRLDEEDLSKVAEPRLEQAGDEVRPEHLFVGRGNRSDVPRIYPEEATYAYWEQQLAQAGTYKPPGEPAQWDFDAPVTRRLSSFSFVPSYAVDDPALATVAASLPGYNRATYCPYYLVLGYESWSGERSWVADQIDQASGTTLSISFQSGITEEVAEIWNNVLGTSTTFKADTGVVFAKVGVDQQFVYEHHWGGSKTRATSSSSEVARSWDVPAGQALLVLALTRSFELRRVQWAASSTGLPANPIPAGSLAEPAARIEDRTPYLEQVWHRGSDVVVARTGEAQYLGSWLSRDAGHIAYTLRILLQGRSTTVLYADLRDAHSPPQWISVTLTVDPGGKNRNVSYDLEGPAASLGTGTGVHTFPGDGDGEFGILEFVSGPLQGVSWEHYDWA